VEKKCAPPPYSTPRETEHPISVIILNRFWARGKYTDDMCFPTAPLRSTLFLATITRRRGCPLCGNPVGWGCPFCVALWGPLVGDGSWGMFTRRGAGAEAGDGAGTFLTNERAGVTATGPIEPQKRTGEVGRGLKAVGRLFAGSHHWPQDWTPPLLPQVGGVIVGHKQAPTMGSG